MLLQVGHERCAACAHSRRIAGTGLMLAVDVAVGVADMDFPELRQQANASTVGRPQFRVTLPAIMEIAGKDSAPLAVSLAL